MPYTIQYLDDLPVPVTMSRMTSPFDMVDDLGRSLNELDALLSQIEGECVYHIFEASELKLKMGDIVQGLSTTFLPHDNVTTTHLMDRRVAIILVGQNPLLELAAAGSGQIQYCGRPMIHFDTLDEALEHICQTTRSTKAQQPSA